MHYGTSLFLTAVDDMTDRDLAASSGLPGWTRKHVVSHVHYNGQALRRLVRWASTGIECRMYESPKQRADEIELGTALPSRELITMLHASAKALAAELDTMTEDAWEQQVVTALGRTVPASQIPWLRTREVIVHSVDLGRGIQFKSMPDDVLVAIASDAVSTHVKRGHAAELAGWLTGRSGAVPTLGKWL
jgi:maleylpyruvate isomerase